MFDFLFYTKQFYCGIKHWIKCCGLINNLKPNCEILLCDWEIWKYHLLYFVSVKHKLAHNAHCISMTWYNHIEILQINSDNGSSKRSEVISKKLHHLNLFSHLSLPAFIMHILCLSGRNFKRNPSMWFTVIYSIKQISDGC